MPNPYYARSYRHEIKERDRWIDAGYYAYRAYASKGDVDVYAFSEKEVVVIAVTVFTNRPSARKAREDTERLLRIPKSPHLRRLRVEYGPIRASVRTPRKETEV
jgi:hypothetical protein